MEIFKELTKKGYNHYYKGTIEELDSMDKDNQHLHCEIMQVIMWLYEKHSIWISVDPENDKDTWFHTVSYNKSETIFGNYNTYNSPTEAYEAAIEYTLNNIL